MKSRRLLFGMVVILAGPVCADEGTMVNTGLNAGLAGPVATQLHLNLFPTGSVFGDQSQSRSEPSNAFLDAGLRTVVQAKGALGHGYDQAISGGMDTWLKMMVALGLVVLQLRRKQKTLPQRPVMDTGNELSIDALRHSSWPLPQEPHGSVAESGVYGR